VYDLQVESSAGRLESINSSGGGVPKTALFEAHITADGINGDVQRDLRYHGGPDRAVSIFSLELIRALQAEGHPIAAGTAGENLTVSGVDWALMTPGRELQIGPAPAPGTQHPREAPKMHLRSPTAVVRPAVEPR
jgi:MOSC domain-containing protein YiiM